MRDPQVLVATVIEKLEDLNVDEIDGPLDGDARTMGSAKLPRCPRLNPVLRGRRTMNTHTQSFALLGKL
jgi:hypothetical protein